MTTVEMVPPKNSFFFKYRKNDLWYYTAMKKGKVLSGGGNVHPLIAIKWVGDDRWRDYLTKHYKDNLKLSNAEYLLPLELLE